jgi:hypothetical protein
MAHEIIQFRQKSRLFEMSTVQVMFALIAHFGIAELQGSGNGDPETHELLDSWLRHLRTTDAFFDPELDQHVQTQRDALRFVALFDAAIDGVNALGGDIPAGLVNELLQFEGIGAFHRDFDRARATTAIQELKELVLDGSKDMPNS